MEDSKSEILNFKSKTIKIVFTDIDGVWTDNGVYYSAAGEELKRFSFRDGMGVERLRTLANLETGIITRENSAIVAKRAEKLKIKQLHLGVLNKLEKLSHVVKEIGIDLHEVAYIGDDVNDLEIMKQCGFTACPSDAMFMIKEIADYECKERGGYGAFREFAELIIKNRITINQ
jgi:3-deoxy-D-manno-octulosonate 8-phosphate phosphatase (KDO 8-P phosphatase)